MFFICGLTSIVSENKSFFHDLPQQNLWILSFMAWIIDQFYSRNWIELLVFQVLYHSTQPFSFFVLFFSVQWCRKTFGLLNRTGFEGYLNFDTWDHWTSSISIFQSLLFHFELTSICQRSVVCVRSRAFCVMQYVNNFGDCLIQTAAQSFQMVEDQLFSNALVAMCPTDMPPPKVCAEVPRSFA